MSRRRSYYHFICDDPSSASVRPSVPRWTEGRRADNGRALIFHPVRRRNVSEETAHPRLTNIFADGETRATVFRESLRLRLRSNQ